MSSHENVLPARPVTIHVPSRDVVMCQKHTLVSPPLGSLRSSSVPLLQANPPSAYLPEKKNLQKRRRWRTYFNAPSLTYSWLWAPPWSEKSYGRPQSSSEPEYEKASGLVRESRCPWVVALRNKNTSVKVRTIHTAVSNLSRGKYLVILLRFPSKWICFTRTAVLGIFGEHVALQF